MSHSSFIWRRANIPSASRQFAGELRIHEYPISAHPVVCAPFSIMHHKFSQISIWHAILSLPIRSINIIVFKKRQWSAVNLRTANHSRSLEELLFKESFQSCRGNWRHRRCFLYPCILQLEDRGTMVANDPPSHWSSALRQSGRARSLFPPTAPMM